MRILIINFYYYPSSEAHSFRWTELAEYWAKKDMQVEVITMNYKGQPRYNIEKKVQVKRVGFTKWESFSYENDEYNYRLASSDINLLKKLSSKYSDDSEIKGVRFISG